jgi:hypothetical protein
MDGKIGVKASCEVWDENDTPHSVYFDWKIATHCTRLSTH